MTLERKTLAIMASTLLVAFIVSYTIGQSVLRRGFAGIEESDAREHLQRAQAVLGDKINNVDYILSDWAAWDDSYEFVAKSNPEYVTSNLVLDTFLNLGVNICAFLDTRGQIVWAEQIDLTGKTQSPLDDSLRDALASNPRLTKHQDGKSVVKGVILTRGRPLLIASRPIIRSNKSGPIRGTIIMGRFLDEDRIESMTSVLLDRPEIFWANQPDLSTEARADFEDLRASRDALIRKNTSAQLACSCLVDDINGQPALMIELHIPREIHRRGQATVRALLVALGSSAAIFALIILRILKGQVLRRVIQLDQTAQSIASSKDVSQRVPTAGSDELSSLAASFNSMLDELEATQKDLRKAKDLAEEASQTKSRFLANVSHEIRTPLNCVIGFAEMILGGNKPEASVQHARTILEHAEMLLELINDLLDNAKIEAGRLELERRPFDLHQLLHGIAALTETQGRTKALQVQLRITQDIPQYIENDSLRIRQVLTNLVTNAVKFTEHGSVAIQAELADCRSPDDLSIRFAVIDTGIGIPKDRQQAIFQSFCQVDAGTTRKYGGTGLGTTIARQLVELMGGQMGLESELGQGSTFWFTLPVKPCGAPPDENEATACPIPQQKANILLAEDYAPSREMMKLILENAGHQVTMVENGAELIAACKRRRYDLIITDLQMPDVDGCQASAAIRKDSVCAGVPIIALTADSAMGARDRFRQVGVDDVLVKPVRRKTLLPAIGRCLSKSARSVAGSTPSHTESKISDPAGAVPMDYEAAVNEFGSTELVNGVAAHFLEDLDRMTVLMREALAAEDRDALRSKSHAIKGGAGTLEAYPLAESALRLERLSESGAGQEDLASALSGLVQETDRLKIFLVARMTHNGGKES